MDFKSKGVPRLNLIALETTWPSVPTPIPDDWDSSWLGSEWLED